MKLSLLLMLAASVAFADEFPKDGYCIITGTNPYYSNGSHVTLECTANELVGGKLILTWRKETRQFWMEGTQTTVDIWKEVYAAAGGKVVLERVIKAEYTPPKTTTQPEQIVWSEPSATP